MGDAGSCDHPLGIDVQTIDGIPASETGEVFKMLKPDKGFVCLNQDQVSLGLLQLGQFLLVQVQLELIMTHEDASLSKQYTRFTLPYNIYGIIFTV